MSCHLSFALCGCGHRLRGQGRQHLRVSEHPQQLILNCAPRRGATNSHHITHPPSVALAPLSRHHDDSVAIPCRVLLIPFPQPTIPFPERRGVYCTRACQCACVRVGIHAGDLERKGPAHGFLTLLAVLCSPPTLDASSLWIDK
jgi:hypothetical protein